MHLEKLVIVLKTFDEARLQRLQQYLASPYFNVPPVCGVLLKRLAALYPHFTEKRMQPNLLGKKDRTLSTAAKQNNAGSNLLRAIEKFIAQEEWQKSNTQMFYQLQGFQRMQLPERFDKVWRQQFERLNAEPEQNFDTFFEKHLLTELLANGFNAKLNRTINNDIMPVVKTLDEFYALKKLRYLCEALNRRQFFGTTLIYHEQHIPSLLKILEPYTNSAHPYVYVFVHIFKMLLADNYENSEPHYLSLKEFYTQHSGKLSSGIAEGVNFAFGHCTRWYNAGNYSAGNEYLWWVDFKLKNNLLLENGKLLPVIFRNIITIAVVNKLNAVDIQKMISTYAPYLPAAQSETYTAFANGLYCYATGQYSKAARYFIQAQAKEEVIFDALIRRWQWSCLYESNRNDTDMLFAQLDSFEKYLQRNKQEMPHVIESFQLFIQHAGKMLKSTTAEQIANTLTALQTEKHFIGKIWLEEQLGLKIKKPVRLAYGL